MSQMPIFTNISDVHFDLSLLLTSDSSNIVAYLSIGKAIENIL